MRGIQTPIKTLRKKVFTEVAKVAFSSKNINDDIANFNSHNATSYFPNIKNRHP